MLETGGIDVILVGSRDEKVLCDDIKSGFGNGVHDLSGLFTLGQLAAVLKASNLFITNDNGPMHIAASVGTKVVALFNKNVIGSNPTRWGPYGEGHIIIYKNFDDITPDGILEHAVKSLCI